MEIIEINNASANAKIALQGAHIFHYQRVEEENILWLSEMSDFEIGKAIRGGIPICWPWFGTPKDESLPAHGFARTALYKLVSINEVDANTTIVTLELNHSKQSLELWPYEFKLELFITISDKLSLELKTTNLDSKTFEITQAFHAYFNVSDILHVEIQGLENKPYLDAPTWQNEVQEGLITFNQEVDRVYQEVDTQIVLKDEEHTLHVENTGSSSVIVWNPWIDKCKRMALGKNDMKEDAYKEFVCIESANAFDDSITIEPNKSHTLKAVIF
jgi:glucose-6-phosphate 1-epimerase